MGDFENFNVGDKLVFDNKDTKGFGAVGEISEVVGPGISSISSEIIDYTNIKFISDDKKIIFKDEQVKLFFKLTLISILVLLPLIN